MASLPAAQSRFRNWPRSGALVRWPGFEGAWIPPLILALILVVLFAKAWLLTAGWSFFDPTHQLTNPPVAFLTYPVWTQHASPCKVQQYLADDAARLLFVLVLTVISLGRVVVAVSRRHAE